MKTNTPAHRERKGPQGKSGGYDYDNPTVLTQGEKFGDDYEALSRLGLGPEELARDLRTSRQIDVTSDDVPTFEEELVALAVTQKAQRDTAAVAVGLDPETVSDTELREAYRALEVDRDVASGAANGIENATTREVAAKPA